MPRLDHALLGYSGYRLRRTTSVALSRMNAAFAQFGLRRTTFSTLALVATNPGMRQSQIAEALAIERTNFVQIVDELEKANLVIRETAVDDRRAYALHATPAGDGVYKKAAAAVLACDRELIAGLSPAQIEQLHEMLEVIDENAIRLGAADA